MKNVNIYIANMLNLDGDSDTYCSFDPESIEKHLSVIMSHLTENEKKHREFFVNGFSIRIPDDYTISTAKQLDLDLCNGDVESPDFDVCCAMYISKPIYSKEML